MSQLWDFSCVGGFSVNLSVDLKLYKFSTTPVCHLLEPL